MTKTSDLRSGHILYASTDEPESIQEAREYIKTNRLTQDDVRLIKHQGQTLVVAKRHPESWRE